MSWNPLRRLFAPWKQAQPASSWHDQLQHCRSTMEAGQYAQADHLLATTAAPGPADQLTVLGLRGECQFQSGQAENARKTTLEALSRAQQHGDADLLIQLWGNLLEVYRYLGQHQAASACAEHLADLHRDDLSERYRQHAQLYRQGEPPLRVVADVDGQRLEIDQVLAGQAGAVRFVYVRDRLTLRPAEMLTRAGETLLHQGRFVEALETFDRAAAHDPHAPEPHYLAGHAHAYQGAFDRARESFRQVESRAPGWFHVRSALWWLDELLASRHSLDLFRSWHTVAEGPLPPEMRLRLVEEALNQAADVPHLHQQRGRLLKERGLGVMAIKALRRSLALSPPADVEARACVDLAALVDDARESQRLLHRVIDLNADLVATALARIVLHFD